MSKIKFYNIPDNEKSIIFQQIANTKNMAPFAVEKDWWVVQTLSIIFGMEIAKHLVFKGGTSLSKAWNLIERFSEDVDLVLDREFLGFKGKLTKNQRTELRKTLGVYIVDIFFGELKARFVEKGILGVEFVLIETKESDKDPRIIEVYYPNVIESPGYLQAKVQIEIGCRSLREPYSIQSFASLVDEEYPDLDFAQVPINVPTVNPERTFLEKIFLLHEEFHRPSEKMRVDRLSRHLYDIYHLAKTDFADKALNDKALYEIIVEHRQIFTHISGVNYNEHQPQTIDFLPIPDVMEAWRSDYKTMVEQMIYEINPPSFDELVAELARLKNRINSLPWKFDKVFPLPNHKL
jgi:predicted nucleotidyltransferase component of viral defense system